MTDTPGRNRFSFHSNTSPLALLAACLLAFGVFLPWLGFYQDDWHFIYYANQGLGKLWELSAYDNRPFASWPYIAGFALMGFRPLAWQVMGLLLRWLTATVFWLFLRALWPEKARLSILPALIFAVYPLYTLQPMAVTYITHWVCYLLYFLSLWLMVLAIRNPRRFWPLFLLSVLLDGLQLFTIEYFNGVELLRPAVLWMILPAAGRAAGDRAKKVLWYWLPYLLALAAFILWRSFIFQSPAQDTNAPTVLRELVNAPLQTLLYLGGAVFKDSLLILAGAWSSTLAPALVDFSPAGLAILLVSLLTFVGFFFHLKNLETDPEPGASLTQMALLGIMGLVLGPIPAWITHQPLYDTNPLWNSRLGMASMFGAAMLVTWMVETLIRTPRQRVFIHALLLALAVGFLLRWENVYRNAWKAEVSFLNQIAWRAPGLAPGTPVISEGELLPLMGDYPTAFAINMIYEQPAQAEHARAWYFPTYGNDTSAEKIAAGEGLTERKFSTRFSGAGSRLLPIWYDPAASACLHILTPADSESRLYSDLLRSMARRSDLTLISPTAQLNERIFREALKIPSSWCRYYQEGELAAQEEDWGAAINLWQEAQGLGLSPTYGPETLPFLRAELATERYSEAAFLTEMAASMTNTQAMRQTLCQVWEAAGKSPDADLAGKLRCTSQGQAAN